VYGLGAIKGLGEGPVASLIRARREGGDFSNLFNFCRRLGAGVASRLAIQALIRAGAFDVLGEHRAMLLASMDEAIKTAEQASRVEASGVDDLFGVIQASQSEDVYAHFRKVRPWSNQRKLQEEKDSLGLWLSGHPIADYLPEIQRMTRNNIGSLRADREVQKVVGLIHDVRINNSRGGAMAVITLDDRSARIDVTLYNELYEKQRELIRKDAVIMVEGVVNVDEFRGDGSLQMRARSLIPFQQARQQYARNITLNLSAEQLKQGLGTLQDILAEYRCRGEPEGQNPSPCEIVVHYERDDVRGDIMLGRDWRVSLHDDLLAKLRQQYGHQHIALNY
jgi:DNA polymerase-3 subunit alpha